LSVGDKRSQRHAKGNWPAFIHIPLDGSADKLDDEGVSDAQTLTKMAREALVEARAHLSSVEIQEFFPVASAAPWMPHLSLAKPFALRKHEVEPFLAALQAAVGQVPSFHISVVREWCFLPGDVKGLDGAEGVLRPERQDLSSRSRRIANSSSSRKCTVDPYFQDLVIRQGLEGGRRRGFLALELATPKGTSSSSKGDKGVPHAGLSKLVAAVDGVLKRFGREPYYDPAHFHVSFAQVGLPTTTAHRQKDALPSTVLSRTPHGCASHGAAATSGTATAATVSTPEPSPLRFLQDYGSESEEDESAADDAAALHCDNFSVLPVSEICLKTGSQLRHIKLRAC
jgi:hypothetical protein